MTRKLAIFILLSLACIACKEGAVRGKYEGMTLASLKGPSSMALIKLIDSLDSDSHTGLRADILDEPLQVRKMMLDGSADFAILPTTMAAILYNKGLDYRLIAIPVWGSLYLFGADTTIGNWEDLRGKRVNVMARGMTPDVLFRYLLEKNGIRPEADVVLDYSYPTHIELANAVAAGQAELAVLSEPLVSMVAARNTNIHPVLDLNNEWERATGIAMAQTALLAKGHIIRNNPELIERVIDACSRSVEWVNSNPDSAAALIVSYGILPDVKTAVASIPRSHMEFRRAQDISAEIEAYLRIFFNMEPDIIGGKIPDEAFIY